MSVDDGVFRTTDMTEAAILIDSGFSYQLEKLNLSMALWAFTADEETLPKLQLLVGSYQNGNHRVEPKKFMEVIGRVRSELYEFLNHVPRRVSKAPSSAS